MRVCVVTSGVVGGAGAALPAITRARGVEVGCVILSAGHISNRRRLYWRKARKVLRIGPFGAINGVRMRKWFSHHGAQNILNVAASLGIPVITVPNVNSSEVLSALRSFDIELGVSLGNPYIAPRIFECPRLGFINYHGELLPEYPGADSIIWAIHDGQTRTGFSIHQIDRGIDTGPILLRREFDIQFRPQLRETVSATGAVIHPQMPGAIADVLADWDTYAHSPIQNRVTRTFTTPTWSQFRTMVANNDRLYQAQLEADSRHDTVTSASVQK